MTTMTMAFFKLLIRVCLGDVGKVIVCVGETLVDTHTTTYTYTYTNSTCLKKSQSSNAFFKWVIDCRAEATTLTMVGMNVFQLYTGMHVLAWCLLVNAVTTVMVQLMVLHLTATGCPFVYRIVATQSLSFLLRQLKTSVYVYI